MLILKTHFPEYEAFTLNIPDSQVTPYINNAETQDMIPVLGDQMYAALRVIFDTSPASWSSTAAYTTGQFSIVQSGHLSYLYKCIQSGTGQAPATSPAYWQLSELGTFFLQYIKPWGVMVCLREFLVNHGVNITQFGIRVADEPTSMPADGRQVEAKIQVYRERGRTYKAKMLNRLKDVDRTFDGVKYEVDCEDYKTNNNNPGNSFKIRAI